MEGLRARQAFAPAPLAGSRKYEHMDGAPAADFSQDSIEMYFEMLAGDDELFRGASLHFDQQPAAATCLSCSDEFSTDAPQPVCPQCGSLLVQLDPDAPMVQLTDVGIDDGTEG